MASPVSPELSLAFGMAASPGVYALLLGSGVSRSDMDSRSVCRRAASPNDCGD